MKTLLAAILGGAIVFAWGAVSWMALGWHAPTLKAFANEDQVAQVLVDNAPKSGIYVLPKPQPPAPVAADTSVDAAPAPASTAPFAFVAFTREGVDPQMTMQMVYAILSNIIAALLVAWLVRAADGLGYFQRVLFIATVGIVIAIAGRATNWIWWHFSTDFMVVDLADVIIGWALAALVMAALTGEERHRLGSSYRRLRA
jgi:hypothetical protein